MKDNLINNAVLSESALNDYVHRHCMSQRDDLVKQLNKLLYEEAEARGISLYELCNSVVPEFSFDFNEANPYEGGGFKIEFVTTIKLKPIE